MDAKEILAYPLRGYLSLRSFGYLAQLETLSRIVGLLPFVRAPRPDRDPEGLRLIIEDLQKLFKRDAENITSGLYPVQVLAPEGLGTHIKRLPNLLIDGIKISRRRYLQNSKSFNKSLKAKLPQLPEYYRRNFHFQTDGYLSLDSAKLYDHQVELLFIGAGDSMRRMCLPPMKRRLNTKNGEGLRILEIACGTGSTTGFVKTTFPEAKIVCTDLSDAYLKLAQQRLSKYSGIDYVQSPGESLPFQDNYFDAVYSVFLFHELPLSIRKNVLEEMFRVLKPGGWNIFVDSLQLNDKDSYNKLLEQFPKDFHEPFYTNYIKNPVEDLFKETGFEVGERELGFLSKMLAGQKPEKTEA